MLVSGGQLLAIDKVVSDNYTISGDGVEYAIGVDTDCIATQENLLNVSSVLSTDIQAVSSNFDNYYLKTETSGSEQLAEEFDTIKKSIIQPYDIQSLTPDSLYAGVSANIDNVSLYVVSATDVQNKSIVLQYNKPVEYTWDELQNAFPNVYVTTDNSTLFDVAVANENVMIFEQHTATKVNSDEHSQISITELQLFKDLTWNPEPIVYTVSDPWADVDTGINISTGRISVNVDDSTIKINENNQIYSVATVQRATYDVTQWNELDFGKTIILDISINDRSATTSLYEKTETSIRWLAVVDDVLYYVDLSNDDTWKLSKLDIDAKTYTAGMGLDLEQNEFSVDTDVIASIETVSNVSAKLSADIDAVVDSLGDYYLKTETSGSEQLAEEFDTIKKSIIQPYDIQSLTPNILYAAVSADEAGNNSYIISATNSAQIELEFDGIYDPVTNKVATVETVNKAVKYTILTYDTIPTQTYSDLLEIAKTGNLYVLNDNEIVLANSFTTDSILFTYVDSSQKLNCYILSSDLTWNRAVESVANDHKVSVAEGTTPNYLQNVLVSDAEEITFTKVDNQLRIGLNLTGESDPKLTTLNESQINDTTDNYGWWNTAYDPPAWSNSGVNCVVYRHKRTSDAQGSLTLCRCAFTNSWGMNRPLFRLGVFDFDMNLLGSSDYFIYDTTVNQFVGQLYNDALTIAQGANVELEIPMHEESVGSLSINRNTRYVIELVSCGIAFAAKTQAGSGVTSNYIYDYTLGNNLMTTQSSIDWWTSVSGKQQANKVPYLSFGASSIGSVSV